jgi:alpha-galactosidase
VIAVNQDSLGVRGSRKAMLDGVEIWFKPLVGGDWAMAILNRGGTAAGDV